MTVRTVCGGLLFGGAAGYCISTAFSNPDMTPIRLWMTFPLVFGLGTAAMLAGLALFFTDED